MIKKKQKKIKNIDEYDIISLYNEKVIINGKIYHIDEYDIISLYNEKVIINGKIYHIDIDYSVRELINEEYYNGF